MHPLRTKQAHSHSTVRLTPLHTGFFANTMRFDHGFSVVVQNRLLVADSS